MVGEQQLRIGNNNYKFQWLKGRVLDVKSLAKTVGGGRIYVQQYTTSSDIRIDSIEQLDIFMEDSSGVEHAFKLDNFNFSCREGHEITMVKVLVNHAKNGPYVSLFNHSTREGRTKYYLLETLSKPNSVSSCMVALFVPIALVAVYFAILLLIRLDVFWQNALFVLLLGAVFIGWVVLYLSYQNRKTRQYRSLKNACDGLPL